MSTNIEVRTKSFVEQCREEDLFCAKGGHVLQNPYMITQCQHLFCRNCLAQEIQKSESLSCPKCFSMIKKDDIIFSSRDNKRLQRIWNSAIGNEVINPYIANLGQDKESIFGARDFFDYEVVSSDIRCSMDSYSAKGKHFKGNLDARDGITIHQCKVDGQTKTSMGSLKGTSCVFNGEIKARDGIELENSKGLQIETSMGKAKITGGSYGSIKARDGITLDNTECQSADVSMGKIIANNTSVNGMLKARDGVQMDDSTAYSVKVSMGKAIISNPNKVGAKISTVEARDGVNLSYVGSKNVSSSMGGVEIFDCTVGSIEARESVKLTKSTANSVTINVPKKLPGGAFGARLELNGDIQGNVKIIVNPNLLSGGGMVSIGSITNCISSIKIASKEIMTGVSETTMDNGIQTKLFYDLKVNGMSYPLSSDDINLIRMCYSDSLDISHDGRIINTYGKIIKIGSQVFGREKLDNEGTSKSNQPKCVLKITGNGTIQGKIEFVNCQGEVDKDSSVNVLG